MKEMVIDSCFGKLELSSYSSGPWDLGKDG